MPTSTFVRNEDQVIDYCMAWTLIIQGYLVRNGLPYYFVLAGAVSL